VPVTACGVVSVDAVSGVNRVFGSIPPGGTSGTAELDPAVEGAEAVVAAGAVGALGEHPLAAIAAATTMANGAMRRPLPGLRAGDTERAQAERRRFWRTPP
jgi:hypothetical protein